MSESIENSAPFHRSSRYIWRRQAIFVNEIRPLFTYPAAMIERTRTSVLLLLGIGIGIGVGVGGRGDADHGPGLSLFRAEVD